LAIYIVISIPKRKSTACGFSQRMVFPNESIKRLAPPRVLSFSLRAGGES
jgi:hypothetical protein